MRKTVLSIVLAFCLFSSIQAKLDLKNPSLADLGDLSNFGNIGGGKYDQKLIDQEIERLKNTEFKNEWKQIEEHKNKAWSCYFLVKQKAMFLTPQLEDITRSRATVPDLQKMVSADMYSRCLARMKPEEGKELLDKMAHDSSFSVADYDTLLAYNPKKYEKLENYEMSETQKMMYKYYEDLEQQINKMAGSEGLKHDALSRYSLEPEFIGMKVSNMSGFMKAFYFLAFLGAISAFFHFAYKRLFTPRETAMEKAKREKAEKKQQQQKAKVN